MQFSVQDELGLLIFDVQQTAGDIVAYQLSHLTPVSLAVLYLSGLVTSLSPCALSLLPLTIAYLAGDSSTPTDDPSRPPPIPLSSSLMFAAGLATALSSLGLGASLLGMGLFGQTSGPAERIVPVAASVLAVVMGLNVLNLVSISFPAFDGGELDEGRKLPKALQDFLFGVTSALIATPCSTPVLTALLGYVASTGDPLLGAALLFAYTLGYASPVVAAGTASGRLAQLLTQGEGREGLRWITPVTGGLLVGYGTFSTLNALFS